MTGRLVAAPLTALVLLMWTAGPVGAQTVPRAPDGKPDLQGVWDFRTMTPLQRPSRLAEQEFLTAEEAAEQEAAITARRAQALEPSEVRTEPLPAGGGGLAVGAYNDFWLDYGTNVVGDRRTSLIVDPPDGRLPPLTPDGEKLRQVGSLWEDLAIEPPIRVRSAGVGADRPEDRGLAERCLVGFNSGPPMMPSGYNNNMQLFQTSDTVVILNEMVHDVRVIPLDGRPHLPEHIRQWMGDARGYWDGDTLVVETTNLTGKTGSFDPSATTAIGSGETLTLTERFSRLDENTLLYEYTVDDPVIFTRPFTVAVPMRRAAEPMFEYARVTRATTVCGTSCAAPGWRSRRGATRPGSLLGSDTYCSHDYHTTRARFRQLSERVLAFGRTRSGTDRHSPGDGAPDGGGKTECLNMV